MRCKTYKVYGSSSEGYNIKQTTINSIPIANRSDHDLVLLPPGYWRGGDVVAPPKPPAHWSRTLGRIPTHRVLLGLIFIPLLPLGLICIPLLPLGLIFILIFIPLLPLGLIFI